MAPSGAPSLGEPAGPAPTEDEAGGDDQEKVEEEVASPARSPRGLVSSALEGEPAGGIPTPTEFDAADGAEKEQDGGGGPAQLYRAHGRTLEEAEKEFMDLAMRLEILRGEINSTRSGGSALVASLESAHRHARGDAKSHEEKGAGPSSGAGGPAPSQGEVAAEAPQPLASEDPPGGAEAVPIEASGEAEAGAGAADAPPLESSDGGGMDPPAGDAGSPSQLDEGGAPVEAGPGPEGAEGLAEEAEALGAEPAPAGQSSAAPECEPPLEGATEPGLTPPSMPSSPAPEDTDLGL